MYAVIRTGGKQVRVAEGDVVRVERLTKKTLKKGAEVSLGESSRSARRTASTSARPSSRARA